MSQENQNVHNLPQFELEKIAHATTGVETMQVPETETQPDPDQSKSPNRLYTALGVAGLTTALALGFAPRGEEPPRPEPKSFTELAEHAAHIPVTAETDTVIVKVKVNPSNPDANTPGEAVLNNEAVQLYAAENPDEVSSLTTSALSLPSTESGTYAVVERDINGDGEKDAVAVPDQDK